MAKKVTVTWVDPSPTTYVDHLEVWRKTTLGGTYAQIGTDLALGVQTYSDESTLADSTVYYYQVRAYNSTGDYSNVEGNITISGVATPAAPTLLAVGTPTSTTIPLTWTKSITGVMTAYRVYDDGVLLQTFTGDVAAGTLTGLTASTTYTNLTVRAFDGTNESADSNSVNGTTAAVSYTTVYTSDFTAGVDGWTATNVTVEGNIDSIGGQNDVLRVYANATLGYHYITRSPIAPGIYRVTFDYYIPNANTEVRGFYIKDATASIAKIVSPSTTPATVFDTWTTVTADVEYNASSFTFKIDQWSNENSSGYFAGSNVVTDDLLYIKNVLVEKQN